MTAEVDEYAARTEHVRGRDKRRKAWGREVCGNRMMAVRAGQSQAERVVQDESAAVGAVSDDDRAGMVAI